MTKEVKETMEEGENLWSDGFEKWDAVKYFQEATAELEVEAVLLKGRLTGAEDFEEDGDHMREDACLSVPAHDVYHLAQFTGHHILGFKV